MDQLLKDFSSNFKNFINSFALKDDEISDIDKKGLTNSFNAISINLKDLMKHFGLEQTSEELSVC